MSLLSKRGCILNDREALFSKAAFSCIDWQISAYPAILIAENLPDG